MGAVAVDARVGRRGDAEQVGPEEVNAHTAKLGGSAHHRGDVAHVGGVAHIAFRERDLDVLEAGGEGADLVEGGLAGGGSGGGKGGGNNCQHGKFPNLEWLIGR